MRGLQPHNIPSRPKILQKTSLQKKKIEAINFVIITKTLCIQLKKLEKDHKKITKIIVSGNYFVIISARMVKKKVLRNFPEPPTPGIFSKVLPVQMGGVLRYKLEVHCGVSLSPKLRSQRGTALQMGGALRYKLEVYRQYFSDKLCWLEAPKQSP